MLHNKFWQAFFAIAPLILAIFFIVSYFILFFSIIEIVELQGGENMSFSMIFGNFWIFFILILLMLLVSLGGLIFYIMHAVQNPNLKQGNLLIVWILLFVFVGTIGKLVYWMVEIIGKKNEAKLKP